MLKKLRSWSVRRTFREGEIVSRFIARDVRRDILVVSAARIDEGIIKARVRTTNLLYLAKGLIREPDFYPAKELAIEEIWHWSGESWGGLPDGTSLVEHLLEPPSEEQGANARQGDAWDGYRRRRASFVIGSLVAVLSGTVLSLLDVDKRLLVAFWIFAYLYGLITWLLFICFSCPACEHVWFGDGGSEDGWREGFIREMFGLGSQKLCSHCGLPKFMDPAGWSPRKTEPSKDP